MKKTNIQTIIAVGSFGVAVILSFMGFFTPPRGDLTEANLYLVAQFLLVTTSIFGVAALLPKPSPKGEGIDTLRGQ